MIISNKSNFIEILMVIIPLLSSLWAVFCNSNKSRAIFSTVAVSISCFCSLLILMKFEQNYCIKILNWIHVGNLNLDWFVCVDRISSIMCFVVTSISLVVHIYSIGYMSQDKNYGRFFSYLSLFTFFMISLVTARNFAQLFFGWEGVGLCSYLLIGFWFHKYSANNAAIKAFVINRFADVFFIIAIMLLFKTFGTLDIDTIHSMFLADKFLDSISLFGLSPIDTICIPILIGCMGKSAQFGLHLWLPDAMEGPTPISALIHAATMVAAGVFVIVKLSFLFDASIIAKEMCLFVGCITCVFCAIIGLAQTDIKKIIAYSTCSQLGYMFMSCGVSAFNDGFFHLITHAFFKALLFLCAGNVIHSFKGEQDITKMGGNCFKKMKLTYVLFLIGSLSLSGLFPLSGFYSKDMIIEALYRSNKIYFSVGVFVAFLTSVYSFKLIILVFHRGYKKIQDDIHESGYLMTLTLCSLAFPAVLVGFLYHNDILSMNFWKDSINFHESYEVPSYIKKITPIASFLGLVYAIIFYSKERKSVIPNCLKNIFKNKMYLDEAYKALFVVTYNYISTFFTSILEKFVDFSIVTILQKSSIGYSGYISRVHRGEIRMYFSLIILTCAFGITLIYFLSF